MTTNSVDGQGIRYDAGKDPMEYVPLHLLAGVARVYHTVTTRDKDPYPPWNWARGMPWSKPYACAIRHLMKWYRGETFDDETGESHIDHAICNLLMLKHYEITGAGEDDRPYQFFSPTLSPTLPHRASDLCAGGMVLTGGPSASRIP